MSWEYKQSRLPYKGSFIKTELYIEEYLTENQQRLIIDGITQNKALIANDGSQWRVIAIAVMASMCLPGSSSLIKNKNKFLN